MTDEDQTSFGELVKVLRDAKRITALTGAGVSAESGIPTFRDALTGLWSRFQPEDLATPEAFQRDPQLVWDWYAERRAGVAKAQPNPGHYALAAIERKAPSFTLITQNVDGLHRRAGSQNVIELHGNIAQVKCSREGTIFEEWDESDSIPRCPKCGAYLRPDVVWFGETLAPTALRTAQAAARNCDVFLVIGTSGLVQPAASLPWLAERITTLVEVNPDPTPFTDYANYVLQGRAGEVLPDLVKAVWAA